MQRKQGYCSYCRVQYPNLEQHLFSAQHRSLTRQNRRRICAGSLMERFLQDVLRHHPYNYQDRTSQDEMYMNAESPEVIYLEDFFSEEYAEEISGPEILSESSESVEELSSDTSDISQEPVREITIRPSVIQKLEKGQQQSLEFVHKIESGMKKINPLDIGQATNNGKKPIRPPVICNAPASCVSERSYDRPVATTTARLPLAVCLDSFSKCDPNTVHKHLEQLDTVSRNPMPSAHVETPVSYKNPKELNRKFVCVNSDKLVLQKDVKSQGVLSPGFKFCELKGTENSVRVKSSSRLPVNSAVNLNKTYKPSDKGIFEDTTPKHHEEFFSNMDCSQEEEHLIFKKTSVLKQKCSVSSEVKFDYGPLQSASDQSQEVVQDLNLWKEEQVDQEDENCESGGSEMSFDCDSSCHSLTDQSDVSDREINLSEEIHADLPLQNNKSYVSKRSSDRNDSVQGVTNQPQVIVKEVGLQNTARISLVDQSYETSGSEMNSDCDEDLSQSANVEEVDLPQEVRICLVDKDYGCSSSESSADSIFSLESEVEDSSVVVTEKQVWKKANVRLVDASYGSSSEASSDCDASPQSVADRPQMTVKGKKPKHRHIHLKHRKRKSSRAKAHLDLDCDVSLETVADEPQRAVEEKKLLKEKNADLLDMNCESHGPEMGFHADAQLVADQSQVAVKEVNAEKVDNDLESVQSSISYLSFDSHAFLYDQPQGDLGEVNLKELNVDMEVKSYGCSSSELTFDSDSPLLSVTERFQLDVERIKEDHINLEDESCESNSSDITFDSDIPDCSVVDQPQVADYEEEPFDLENKSNESCISEITFDSDIPLHSGNDQPEVAVEVIIQEEEYVHLERKNDKPNGSEINLDSYAPLHSVTNPPEVADKKLSPQKEEQVLFKNKENEPADSKLNLAYDTIFPSMTGHSEDPIKDINFQKEEYIHLENKFNELSISKTRLDSNMRLQSVIKKPEVVVKNIWLPKEKHAEFQGKNAEFSGSKINSDSDIPHYSVAEPQVAAKRKEKRKHLLEESPKCDSSQLLLNSDVLPQSIIKKPQLTVLKKAHVDPEGQSTELKGFKMNLNVDSSLHSVTDQPQLALLKEKHVDLKDKSSKPSNSNISFNAIVPLQTAPEQRHIVAKNINLWKEETIGLDAKNEEPSTSKAVRDTVVSFHSRADQSKVAIKQINLESEDQMYLEIKNSQYSSETSLDPDFLVQATVDRPQITILEPEHLEGKHSQSCDSEVSFDSDDSLQSVADQLRETVKEISLWKDEDIDMEDKRDETESFKIMYGSDVLQPAADQTKEVVQRINLWKEHVDLEDKTVKSGDSKINFDSDKPLQSVTNKAQELVNKINLQREGRVCLDDKGYEPDVSRIIYVPNIPHQSVIQQPQILEEEHASLEVKSSDPCGPEIRFDSGGPSQSVAGQLQKTVKEINLKEDHIYLEDKSYKLVDCEACYDSDVPVQFVADQSHLSIKEINLQKKNNNDLENKNYIPCCSEIRCDSGVHLQSEVDPSKVVYKETDLQKRELLGMEEKSSEPSDSEMMYDSDVSFQIVVNPSQMSDGESDSPQVVFVDVVASDSDCDREVISDSNIPVQLVTDPSHMTIPETSYINAESVNIENNYCNYCGSQLRNVCEASQSVTNQPKESFRIINRKNDYIILGDSTCQSCGYEIDFNGDASDQSMTYQSQGPDRKCIDSEDERGEGDGSKRNFNLENTSQPVTHQLQHADQEVNVWKDQKDKSWDSSASAVGSATPSTSGIHQTTVRKSVLKRRHTDSESTSCKSCGSEMQGDSSHHSDQCQEAMKKRRVKRVTFDLGEKDNDSQSDYVPMADSVRNVEKAKVVINDSNEPVLEASPHVPPSFVGKTWSQIIRENDIKINALVKEFKEGRFRCYFDDDSETKKVSLSKQKKTTSTWSDFNQSTASVQTVSNHEDIAGGIPEADQFSVALEKSCCHVAVAEKFLPKQNWQMASPSQTEKVSHGTQTSFISYPLKKRKIVRQEEESPKKKCLQSDRKEKKKVKIQMIELPASHSKVLDPVQPRPLVRVLSSLNLKPKEGESCSSPKANHCVCDNDLEFLCKYKQSNRSCPSLLKIVNNLPPNLVISAADMCKYNIHLHEGDLISTAGENDAVQNLASTSHVIIPARYELRSRRGTGESSVFLENSEVNASEVSEEDNFQLTLLSRDVAKISPKLVRNEFFESKSKKKTQRRNVTTSKTPSFPKRVYKTIILRQKARITPEKWSIWNRTKANDIIRKYISKYSTFLRHRYQSRTTFIGMQLKKKSVASRLEDTERSLILLDTSVPPAGAKEKLRAIVSPLKQSAQHSSNAVGRKKPKKSYRRKKKRPRPVREYDLRSSCYIPDSDRMMTRLASKLKSNEVK